MTGGGGDDRILALGGDDGVRPGAADDRADGGKGADVVYYLEAPRGVDVDLEAELATGWGRDRIERMNWVHGSRHDDRLLGRRGGWDLMWGNRGDDQVDGRGGIDYVFGGLGNDVLVGGGGADTIEDGFGKDRFFGGSGNDRLKDQFRGMNGPDEMDGGRGKDRCIRGEEIARCESTSARLTDRPY